MEDEKNKKKKLSLSVGKKLTIGGLIDQKTLRSGSVNTSRNKTIQVEVRRKKVLGNTLRQNPHQNNLINESNKLTQNRNQEIKPKTNYKEDTLTEKERQNRFNVLKQDKISSNYDKNLDNHKNVLSKEKAQDKKNTNKNDINSENLNPKNNNSTNILDRELLNINLNKIVDPNLKSKEKFGPTSDISKSKENNVNLKSRREAEEAELQKKPLGIRRNSERRRQSGKITISQAQAINEGDIPSRQRSLASVKRQREKAKLKEMQPTVKQTRDVVIPDVITVQELANRMAEKAADVVKELMKLGIMATATQTLDAETAELITMEFGHKIQRVSESDVEEGIEGLPDDPSSLKSRPPVVTIMGHVDHGKTSLLDKIRESDVASGETGGITQHIGAYQILTKSKNLITFIDTPGHEAFTEMRSRGANITDIVILVVAADDSVKPQTIEAINHSKAAKCPLIIAINKCDKPEADAQKVRNDLLNHDIITEEFGGDVLSVEVSAQTGLGLDKLEEAIMLQAELLEITANPDTNASGVVLEAKVERGKGSVGTIIVQKGTLKIGDIFVAGSEFGKTRALINHKNEHIKLAKPSQPVEVLGLNGTPISGDKFTVVDSEAKAREISEYRKRNVRDTENSLGKRGSVEQMLSEISEGEIKELPIILKTDVHGSLEAIKVALEKLSGDEVKVNIINSGVGALSESDLSLAIASNAIVLGFNVRAIPQARELAKRDNVEIRYHSIIYELIDEIKLAMSGLLTPDKKEQFIGYAQIKQVFSMSKIGKVAGCIVTEGIIKRGCKVRLLRENVVIHEGSLKTLKRFKDEVKDVREGNECGMAFDNYSDIHENDIIECFEVIEIARSI